MQNVSYYERKDPESKPQTRFTVSLEGKDEEIDSVVETVEKLESIGVPSFDMRVNSRGFNLDTRFNDRASAIKAFKSLGGK